MSYSALGAARRPQTNFALAAALATALLGAACGERAATAPDVVAKGSPATPATPAAPAAPATAAALERVAADTQALAAGRSANIAVRVRSADGAPLPDAEVRWAVGEGGGSVTPASSRTDAEGIARTEWSAPTVAGSYQVRATVAGVETAVSVPAAVRAAGVRTVMLADLAVDGVFTVARGGTLQPDAHAFDRHGNQVAGTYVTHRSPRVRFVWESLDPSVATVDDTGLVRPVATGTARLVVRIAPPAPGDTLAWPLDPEVAASGVADTTRVRVVERIVLVNIVDANGNAGSRFDVPAVGRTVQLGAKVYDAATKSWRAPEGAVTWTSSAPLVATVDARGVVTGRGLGSATIAVEADGGSASATVQVLGEVEYLGLSERNVVLAPGQEVQLDFSATGPGGTPVSGFQWVSSNPYVATVDAGGRVRAIKEGFARVTVYGQGAERSAFVAVRNAATVARGVVLRTVSAAAGSACGLTTAGDALCWGSGDAGQLGTGTRVSSPMPVRVQGGPWAKVSAGARTTCGIATDGAAFCWGELPDGARDVGTVPGCANYAGQCADAPTAVAGGLRLSDVSVGGVGFDSWSIGERRYFARVIHACGIEAGTGAAYCWGSNNYGQLGTGTEGGSAAPVAVAGGIAFKQVSAGYRHTCGVAVDGRAYCWGQDRQGELGTGAAYVYDTPRIVRQPAAVAGNLTFVSVSAGEAHSCGVTTSGAVYCWGEGTAGQLGATTLGTCAYWKCATSPVRVQSTEQFIEVAAGREHSCALSTSGAAWCWGSDSNGKLGDGESDLGQCPSAGQCAYTPVRVFSDVPFATLDVSTQRSCAVARTTGVLYCWGYYSYADETGSAIPTAPMVFRKD